MTERSKSGRSLLPLFSAKKSMLSRKQEAQDRQGKIWLGACCERLYQVMFPFGKFNRNHPTGQ